MDRASPKIPSPIAPLPSLRKELHPIAPASDELTQTLKQYIAPLAVLGLCGAGAVYFAKRIGDLEHKVHAEKRQDVRRLTDQDVHLIVQQMSKEGRIDDPKTVAIQQQTAALQQQLAQMQAVQQQNQQNQMMLNEQLRQIAMQQQQLQNMVQSMAPMGQTQQFLAPMQQAPIMSDQQVFMQTQTPLIPPMQQQQGQFFFPNQDQQQQFATPWNPNQ